MAKLKPTTKIQIPSWLWFPIFSFGDGKWSDEKQKMAERVLALLDDKSQFECWDPKVLATLTRFNKDDSLEMY